jgi:voltage-gated sodium channel
MKKNIFFTITESSFFQRFIIGIIVLAGILVGLETYPDLHAKYFQLFKAADLTIQGIFTIEITLRILACGKTLGHFSNQDLTTLTS